jgi:hypothetical protein
MPSGALRAWEGERADRLDELEEIHRRLTGTAPGRRWLTEQLNRAYVVALASQFQGFCRDLHSEAAALVASRARANVRALFEATLILGRHLDRGNATAGNLGSDFARFGFDLWPTVYAADSRGVRRREMLDQVMAWRNAIAHDSPLSTHAEEVVGETRPTLTWGRKWRRGLGALAVSMDDVVGNEIAVLIGRQTWWYVQSMPEVDEIKVGDVVQVHYGSRPVEAVVLEDRGSLGVGGERLLRVGWVPSGSDERIEFEVRASNVSPRGVSFEAFVKGFLERLPVKLNDDPPQVGGWQPDYVLSLPDGPLLVEAKAFAPGTPARTVDEVVRKLRDVSSAYGAHEAVIVVPTWDLDLVQRGDREGVSVVPLGELQDWLDERLAA